MITCIATYVAAWDFVRDCWVGTSVTYAVSALVWYAPDVYNVSLHLSEKGYTKDNAFDVPTALYPRGIRPSGGELTQLFLTAPPDPYGFKDLLGSRLAAVPASHSTASAFSINYGKVPDADSIKAVIDSLKNVPDYVSTHVDTNVSEYDWAEMANTCVDNCRSIDINGIAYIKEGIELCLGIVRFIKTGKFPDQISLADLWLSSRYGLRLTAIDTATIVDAAKEAARELKREYRVAHARSTQDVSVRSDRIIHVTRQLNYKVYYNRIDEPTLNVLRTIANWDLWPSAKNVWDLVPFSFVVDWLVDVQSQLERLDQAQYEQFLHILSVLYTEKWTYAFDPAFFGSQDWVCGEMEMTYYHRRRSPSLHYAPLRFGGGHASNINWVDGAMLVIQKGK